MSNGVPSETPLLFASYPFTGFNAPVLKNRVKIPNTDENDRIPVIPTTTTTTPRTETRMPVCGLYVKVYEIRLERDKMRRVVTFLLALALCCGVMVGFAGKAFAGWMNGSTLNYQDSGNGRWYDAWNGIDNYGGYIHGCTSIQPKSAAASSYEMYIYMTLMESDNYWGPYWPCYSPGWASHSYTVPLGYYISDFDSYKSTNWLYYRCSGTVYVSYSVAPSASPVTLAD